MLNAFFGFEELNRWRASNTCCLGDLRILFNINLHKMDLEMHKPFCVRKSEIDSFRAPSLGTHR